MTPTDFLAVGHVYKADYGDRVFRVAFGEDGKTLRWVPFTVEDFEAAATTEIYQATYIRPGVFMVTWKEADDITVTHVEDFENGSPRFHHIAGPHFPEPQRHLDPFVLSSAISAMPDRRSSLGLPNTTQGRVSHWLIGSSRG
jgi:hypothetical protein